MFSKIDKTIFPNSCEVLEIIPSQLYVYPIFKCGKSSLYEDMDVKGWKLVVNDDIKEINTPITVFLRNPRGRFISGVNTFLQHVKEIQPSLDENTVLWFVDNYPFLNRHYCPQFFWLLNLSKYLDSNTKLRLDHYKNISNLTHRNSNAGVTTPTREFLSYIEKFNWEQFEIYFYLDQILIDRIGQEFTISELVNIVQTQYPEVYKSIFESSLHLARNVLPKT